VPCRWRIVVEYHGGDFVGWQVQPNGRSVQGVLTDAAASLFGESVRVDGSGRTDAGVHALGQVAAFTTAVDRTRREVVRGFNAFLPDDVAVVSASRVPLAFDPRRWTVEKRYRYTYIDREARAPLYADRAWFVGRPLHHEAMAEAVLPLLGTHDFAAFRATRCAAVTTVRTMDGVVVERCGSQVLLTVRGHGFLRHMVRIIAGSLAEVGLERRPPGWIGEVLAGADRSQAGRTAPAHGLTLISVTHGERRRKYGHVSHSLDRT